MTESLSRREAISVGAAAVGACLLTSTSAADAQQAEETQPLDALYRELCDHPSVVMVL